MKLYPLLPLIFIAAYTFVAISILIDQPKTAATAIAVLAGFLVLYFIAIRRGGHSPKEIVEEAEL
jgi:APA family basic amino acid/polyamine antiporter